MKKKTVVYDEQRIKIFEAAASVMISNGSLNITMDDIADKLNGTKGTLYYYFKSKAELLYDMQIYAYDMTERVVYEVLEMNKSLPAKERLELFLRSHCDVFFDNWTILRALWTNIAFHSVPPELKRVITRRRRKYEKTLQALIEETAEEEGLICIEPKVSTRIVLGLINSISSWYSRKRGGIKPEVLTDLTIKRAINGLFDKKEA